MIQMIKIVIRRASSSICLRSYCEYQCHFLVLVGKIKRFFLEKLRMELKYHRYDVTFLMNSTIQKNMSNTEIFFVYCTVENGMKMFEFLKFKAMHHNVIDIQVLDSEFIYP